MTDVLNAPDRAWERLAARYPALGRLVGGSKDWQTWIHHAVITVLVGQLAGWLFPGSGLFWMRFFVVVYLCREIANVADRRRIRLPLKPLDHVCDVLFPLVACELVGWLS